MKIKIVTVAGSQSFESTQDVPAGEPHVAHNAIVQSVSNALNLAMQAKLPITSLAVTVE